MCDSIRTTNTIKPRKHEAVDKARNPNEHRGNLTDIGTNAQRDPLRYSYAAPRSVLVEAAALTDKFGTSKTRHDRTL